MMDIFQQVAVAVVFFFASAGGGGPLGHLGRIVRLESLLLRLPQVRTLVGLVTNVWSWSMRCNSTLRQALSALPFALLPFGFQPRD